MFLKFVVTHCPWKCCVFPKKLKTADSYWKFVCGSLCYIICKYIPSGEIRKSTFYIRFLFTDHTVFEAPSLMPFLRIAFHPMPTKKTCASYAPSFYRFKLNLYIPGTNHCWYIEPRNREKSLRLIWQRFSCLLDEWIAKIYV